MAALAPAQAARALWVDNHPTQWWTRPQPSRWHAGFLRGVGGGGLRAPIPASARRGSDRSARFRREASASAWSSAPALGARALGAEGVAYDPATCALLSNSISQEPLERISFERVCNSIVKARMRFRLFAVEYDPAQDGRAKPPQ